MPRYIEDDNDTLIHNDKYVWNLETVYLEVFKTKEGNYKGVATWRSRVVYYLEGDKKDVDLDPSTFVHLVEYGGPFDPLKEFIKVLELGSQEVVAYRKAKLD